MARTTRSRVVKTKTNSKVVSKKAASSQAREFARENAKLDRAVKARINEMDKASRRTARRAAG